MFALIDAMPMYLRAMTVLGAACGMRFGECAGLVRSKLDVADYATAHVIVDEQVHPDGTRGVPKSRGAGLYAKRRAPLPEWAVEFLREYLSWRGPMLPTAYVSRATGGGLVSADVFDHHFAKAQRAVYGADRGFTHKTLRHWHISHRQAGGDGLAAIQRTVGHRPGSGVTAASYTHGTAEADEHTRRVLNGLATRVGRAWNARGES
jgi:integrase